MGDGGKIEPQDLIPDRTLKSIFINCMTLRGWGSKIELQDKLPDMTLTTIFMIKTVTALAEVPKRKENEEKHENIQQIEGKMH